MIKDFILNWVVSTQIVLLFMKSVIQFSEIEVALIKAVQFVI